MTALEAAAQNAFAEAVSLGMQAGTWDIASEPVKQAWRYIAEAAIKGMAQGINAGPCPFTTPMSDPRMQKAVADTASVWER